MRFIVFATMDLSSHFREVGVDIVIIFFISVHPLIPDLDIAPFLVGIRELGLLASVHAQKTAFGGSDYILCFG